MTYFFELGSSSPRRFLRQANMKPPQEGELVFMTVGHIVHSYRVQEVITHIPTSGTIEYFVTCTPHKNTSVSGRELQALKDLVP